LHVSTALAATFLAGFWLREIHALTKRPLPLTTKHQPPACAEATAGRLAALSDPPFPLQNVKEQARGRQADSILPRYYGNSNNKCKMFSRAQAVFMPGGGFSGGFFSRSGPTPQRPISSG